MQRRRNELATNEQEFEFYARIYCYFSRIYLRGWKGRGALKIRTFYLATAHPLSRFWRYNRHRGWTPASMAGIASRSLVGRRRLPIGPGAFTRPSRSGQPPRPVQAAPGLSRSDEGCRPLDSYEIFT